MVWGVLRIFLPMPLSGQNSWTENQLGKHPHCFTIGCDLFGQTS